MFLPADTDAAFRTLTYIRCQSTVNVNKIGYAVVVVVVVNMMNDQPVSLFFARENFYDNGVKGGFYPIHV